MWNSCQVKPRRGFCSHSVCAAASLHRFGIGGEKAIGTPLHKAHASALRSGCVWQGRAHGFVQSSVCPHMTTSTRNSCRDLAGQKNLMSYQSPSHAAEACAKKMQLGEFKVLEVKVRSENLKDSFKPKH